MDLRARGKLRSRLNEKEWMITRTKRKRECAKYEGNQKKVLIRKRCRDGRKVDTFCWICHKTGRDKVCSQCPRVYHQSCLKGSFTEHSICPECQLISINGEEEGCAIPSSINLKELLMYAVDRVFSAKNVKDVFFEWPQDQENNNKLYQVMDAEILCQKLTANCYKKPVEIFSDFKWMYHNCCIVYGDKSEITLCAEQLTRKFKEELLNLEACTECYFYKNSKEVDEKNFFCQICTKRHEIVCAKVKGFAYWPAKCLKVMKNGSAHVTFFGTHEVSCIAANMWFSLEGQSSKLSPQQQQYNAGIKELLGYIDNLKVQSDANNVHACKTTLKCDKESQTSMTDFYG